MSTHHRSPELSVVVCSHNGERNLPNVLESLSRQTLEPGRYEVIVVDDGSTDGTSEIAASRGVRVVRLDPNAGLAAARNAGVSAADGDIVAFTDDDCEVAPDWAGQLLAAFEDPGVDGACGRVVPESRSPFIRGFLTANNPLTPLKPELLESNSLLYRLLLYIRGTLFGDGELPHELYSVVGANMSFRRRLILELDGFDEDFRFGAEEEDFCRRAHTRPSGARLLYVHSAVVVHWFQESVGDIVRRSRAYGRGNARRVLKHPETRLIVYPLPVIVTAAFCVAAMTRQARIATLGVLVPLLAYPRWAPRTWQTSSVAPVTHPYLQLAQEAAAMLGEVDGLRAGYRRVPSQHLRSEPKTTQPSP